MSADFIPVPELSRLTGFAPKSIYNQHASGSGALAPILTKFGGRLGAWRADYETLISQQRRLGKAEKAAA